MQTARDSVGRRSGQTRHAPSKKMLIAWCGLGLILGVCTGQAAMRYLSLEELARKADTIVLGTVIHQESAWDAEHTAIYTKVTLAVERVLVGSPMQTVTLQVAGGAVGGVGMRTSNDAVFREGERVIVCLDTSAVPGSLVGLQQGKFLVQDDTVSRADETWRLDAFSAAVRAVAR